MLDNCCSENVKKNRIPLAPLHKRLRSRPPSSINSSSMCTSADVKVSDLISSLTFVFGSARTRVHYSYVIVLGNFTRVCTVCQRMNALREDGQTRIARSLSNCRSNITICLAARAENTVHAFGGRLLYDFEFLARASAINPTSSDPPPHALLNRWGEAASLSLRR